MEPSTGINILSFEPQDGKVEEKEPNKVESRYQINAEKVSIWKLTLFMIYTASFLVVINMRTDFFLQYSVNISATQFYLNELKTGYNTYQTINKTKLAFHDVDTKQELIKYIKNTIIYGNYQTGKGDIPETSSDEFSHFLTATSLRILLKRSSLKHQPGNSHFPTRWNLETTLPDQTSYGGPNMKFYYNQEQEGFVLSIPMPLISYKEALKQFDDAIDNGFFDSQMKEVTIDFGVYNRVNKIFFVLKLELTFSPTGRVQSLGEVSSSLVDFYDGVKGKILMASQIIFCCLFLFFVTQEMTELYAEIKNTSSKYKKEENKRVRVGHLRRKVTIILKGIMNHLKDPWNLLDAVSLGICVYLIILWVNLLQKNTLRSTLDYITSLPEDKKSGALSDFNHTIDQIFTSTILMQRLAGVNIIVLFFKLLKYIASFNDTILDQIRILVNISQRVLPYIFLITTILLAYGYLVYLLYGKSIEEFSTYFTSLRYLLTNIHSNYDKMSDIFKQNQTLAVVFHILVILILNFVIVNMFTIYVLHAYDDYIKAKKAMKKRKNKDIDKSSPHPIWLLKNFLNKCADILFCKFCFMKARIQKEAMRQKKKEEEMAQLHRFSRVNIDMKMEDEIQKSEVAILNPIFQTEAVLKKTEKRQKLRIVKLIWSSLSIFVAFCFLAIISMEHHKVYEAQYFSQSVTDILKQDNILKFSKNNEIIRSFTSQTDFVRLQEIEHIGLWINDLFVMFLYLDSIILKDSEIFEGFYLASQHFILTEKLRLSTRIRSFQQIGDEEVQGFGNLTLSPLFEPDALNVEDEYKLPIEGKSGTIYEYTEGEGYRNAGGYIIEGNPQEFRTMVSYIYNDDFLNARVNSVVLDFPIYLIKAKNAMRVSIIFKMNLGAFIDTEININFINLHNYETIDQYIIAFLEVVTLVWTVILTYKVFVGLRRRNYHYNYWHSFHIHNLPEVLKEKRERKCPEFLRKMNYLFNLEFKLDIGIIFFILISAGLWIYYFIGTQSTKEHLVSFTAKAPTITNGELLADLDLKHKILFILKITESLALLLMSIKLVYYYSFFNKFRFLIETMRKSLKRIPHTFTILLFILMAFGFFLQLLRGTKDKDYVSISNIVAQQLQFLNLFETQDRTIFDRPTGVFVSLVFYVPWVLFVISIVGNIFFGVVFYSYQSVQEKNVRSENIKVLEFLKLTKELITSKKNKYQQNEKVHFEVDLKDTKNVFNYHRLYDELNTVVGFAKSYCNNIALWTAACSKNILDEHKLRKTMRKMLKDISMVSLVDFNFDKHEHRKILTDNEKFSQLALRLKYWDYFRFGRTKILQFMDTFNKSLIEFKSKGPSEKRVMRLQRKADLTIERYIAKLESEISKNVQELVVMKKTLYQYQQEMVNLTPKDTSVTPKDISLLSVLRKDITLTPKDLSVTPKEVSTQTS